MYQPLDLKVFSGLNGLGTGPDVTVTPPDNSTRNTVWGVLSAVSSMASGYHGYKRNNSVGWGVAWFVLGGLFPVITPTVALAQGFGKRKGR